MHLYVFWDFFCTFCSLSASKVLFVEKTTAIVLCGAAKTIKVLCLDFMPKIYSRSGGVMATTRVVHLRGKKCYVVHLVLYHLGFRVYDANATVSFSVFWAVFLSVLFYDMRCGAASFVDVMCWNLPIPVEKKTSASHSSMCSNSASTQIRNRVVPLPPPLQLADGHEYDVASILD